MARANVDTHFQNGSAAWPLSRHSFGRSSPTRSDISQRMTRPPRLDTFLSLLMKNRESMSMYPRSPSASDDVPNSVQSFGAAVAVASSRYWMRRMNSVTAAFVAPSKLLRMLDSSHTTPPKSAGSKRCSCS